METIKYSVRSLDLIDAKNNIYKLTDTKGETVTVSSSQIMSSHLGLSGLLVLEIPDVQIGQTISFINTRGFRNVLTVTDIQKTALSTYYIVGRKDKGKRVIYDASRQQFLEYSAH